MKILFFFLIFSLAVPAFTQMIVFNEQTMTLKEPLLEDRLFEVNDTIMRKVVFVKHENAGWKVLGFKFGYNDAGLFQTQNVIGEVVPVKVLKKALDGKTNRIYFNELTLKSGYQRVIISFVLRIIYN